MCAERNTEYCIGLMSLVGVMPALLDTVITFLRTFDGNMCQCEATFSVVCSHQNTKNCRGLVFVYQWLGTRLSKCTNRTLAIAVIIMG